MDSEAAAGPGAGDQDIATELCARVAEANSAGTPLRIAGGGTKAFYGRPVDGAVLDLTGHRGITHYDPVELIVSVRAGTPLTELERTLAESGQQLPFEPPHFGSAATVGGMVSTGLSGPRRPWSGAVRDFVLGTRLISQEGQHLRFGGEVMKNVAGYDLSRLVTGAQGTLGVITEVSLKVLPLAAATHSLRLQLPLEAAMAKLAKWSRQPVPADRRGLAGRHAVPAPGGGRPLGGGQPGTPGWRNPGSGLLAPVAGTGAPLLRSG
jgi:glycolate oxidase FAD binding subunit